MKKSNLLEIQGLTVSLGSKPLLRDINLQLAHGEVLGLVGKSGCGKSTLALTIAALFMPEAPLKIEGQILFNDEDILKMSNSRLQEIRKNDLGIVFQEAQSSLNPLMRIGRQVGEVLKDKNSISELLRDVGLEDIDSIIKAYPHELSGGMRQRVLIAIALAKNPQFIILDEPTTSLDSTLKVHILDLLKRLQQKNITMLYISHNLAEVASLCSRVAVMDEGVIVEEGPFSEILRDPQTEAAKELVNSIPRKINTEKRLREGSKKLLTINNLSVSYQKGKKALDNLSLEIHDNEIVGIIGESGSGKSTLAKALVGLVASTGNINFLNCQRRDVQIIFQDPYGSLNPKMSVREALLEPLLMHKTPYAKDLVEELLTKVLLPKHYAEKSTSALSGGERQRVSIARALTQSPKLLIMDESLASLDGKTQLEIADFLIHLQKTTQMAILFIAHDLNLVSRLSDRTYVLYQGMLMEEAPTASLFEHPAHPYTQTLLSSMPHFEGMTLIEGKSSVKETWKEPCLTGCPFRPHCPSSLPICATNLPPLAVIAENHQSRCFIKPRSSLAE